MHDGPLDMRMSKGEGVSAADVVNGASEAELIRIFREFGEERLAPRIARAIVADRRSRPFERTLQLAGLIERVARVPRGERFKHPATRVFQALRIHVNGELEELEAGLEAALDAPGPARAARRHQFSLARGSRGEALHARPLAHRSDVCRTAAGAGACAAEAQIGGQIGQPDAQETARNPRARSARLRVAERLSTGWAA